MNNISLLICIHICAIIVSVSIYFREMFSFRIAFHSTEDFQPINGFIRWMIFVKVLEIELFSEFVMCEMWVFNPDFQRHHDSKQDYTPYEIYCDVRKNDNPADGTRCAKVAIPRVVRLGLFNKSRHC